MQLQQDQNQRQIQAQKIAPHLIQANALLQCSNAELWQVIEQERNENPALDDLDELDSGREAAVAGIRTSENDTSRAEREERMDFSFVDYDRKDTAATQHGDSDFDPLLLAPARTSLSEQLLSHLRANARTSDEVRVAEYLVDALDERGWLQIDPEEACAVLQIPCTLLMEGIRHLQECDPPGIGARDLRECLLLQMRHWQDEDAGYDPVAETLIRDHWEALIKQRHHHLPRRLGLPHDRIEEALHFIKSSKRLTPYPAGQFRAPWDHRPDGQSATVRPDVVIRRGSTGFEVDVLGFDNLALHINPHYRRLYETIRDARGGGKSAQLDGRPLTADHQKHVVAYVERANLFLKNIQQRRRTIQKIAKALIETQQGFLETGQRRFLRPLTRTRLADLVGMHESTISRALLHKYVQLPSQEVVPFDLFFEQAVSVKEALQALIADEDPDSPLSDQAIMEALKQRGIEVARRTVVKYREELRIQASYLRRRR